MAPWAHKFEDLVTSSSTIRKCSHVGGSVSVGVVFENSDAKARSSVLPFLLSTNPDVELLTPSLRPCLPVHHSFYHDDNGLNF